MADCYDLETRSRTMRAVRARDTKPELVLRRALYAAGIRGWRLHRRDLPGCPDLVFFGKRVAVFVDGAFWHGRADKWWPGRSGSYWDTKIRRNIERDRAANAALREAGWEVVRLWDDEILKVPDDAVDVVRHALDRR